MTTTQQGKLTDKEIDQILDEAKVPELGDVSLEYDRQVARAIEAEAEARTAKKAGRFSIVGDEIFDSDFEHDAKIRVSGDFASASEKQAYLKQITAMLNDTAKKMEALVEALRLAIPHINPKAVHPVLVRTRPVSECYINTLCAAILAAHQQDTVAEKGEK